MDKDLRRYHSDVLAIHNNLLFNELLYEHHVTSNCLKEIEFEDHQFSQIVDKGYFAVKDRTKYWIDEETYKHLPIRPNDCVEYKNKEDVVFKPMSPVPFKITAKKIWQDQTEFFKQFLPFEHSNPIQYDISKMVAIMGYVSKNFVCVASNPEFGKSSAYQYVHAITNLSPVFEPRSIPGVLNKITSTGNMVFDDVFSCEKKVRDIMESINYNVGGGSPTYINGALQTKNTKGTYDCTLQSITYLYNRYQDYKDQKSGNVRRYWHSGMWDNVKAMDSRFLQLMFEGNLTQRFSKQFNMRKCAEQNKMFYINNAKHLLWLQQYKQSDSYKIKYDWSTTLRLNNRKRQTYEDILWFMDLVSKDQSQFKAYQQELDKCIRAYANMTNKALEDSK